MSFFPARHFPAFLASDSRADRIVRVSQKLSSSCLASAMSMLRLWVMGPFVRGLTRSGLNGKSALVAIWRYAAGPGAFR